MIPLDAPDLRAKFALEARERLKQLTSAFLRIEQTPEDGETIAEALRQVHSLKGSALMLQLKDIAQVAHSLEDLFVAAQGDAAILRPSTFDAVLGALDVLTLRVEQVERGASIPADVDHLCEAIAALAAQSAESDTGPAEPNRTARPPQMGRYPTGGGPTRPGRRARKGLQRPRPCAAPRRRRCACRPKRSTRCPAWPRNWCCTS